MINFSSSANTNIRKNFISEAGKELEKLDIFISPPSFVNANIPQQKKEISIAEV